MTLCIDLSYILFCITLSYILHPFENKQGKALYCQVESLERFTPLNNSGSPLSHPQREGWDVGISGFIVLWNLNSGKGGVLTQAPIMGQKLSNLGIWPKIKASSCRHNPPCKLRTWSLVTKHFWLKAEFPPGIKATEAGQNLRIWGKA